MRSEDVEQNVSGVVTTLSRCGLGTRTLAMVRVTTSSGAGANGGKSASCANFGHSPDDESGLICMRARYYEPSSGRFVSEDPAKNRANWYSSCSLNRIERVDVNGHEVGPLTMFLKSAWGLMGLTIGFAFLMSAAAIMCWAKTPAELTFAVDQAVKAALVVSVSFAVFLGNTLIALAAAALWYTYDEEITALVANIVAGGKTYAASAVMFCAANSLHVISLLFSDTLESLSERGGAMGRGEFSLSR